jgi:hypothetical protein
MSCHHDLCYTLECLFWWFVTTPVYVTRSRFNVRAFHANVSAYRRSENEEASRCIRRHLTAPCAHGTRHDRQVYMLLRRVAPTVARSIHGIRVATMATSAQTQSVIVHLHVNDLRTTDSPALSLAHSQGKKHVTHFLPLYVFDERILPLDCVPGYSVSAQTKAIEKMTTVDKSSDDEIKPLGQEDEPVRTSNNRPATRDRKDRLNGRVGPRSRLGNFWRVGRHRAKFLVETVFDLKRSYDKKGGGMLLACGKPEEVAIKVVEALVKSGVKVDGVYTQKEVSFMDESL